MKLLAPIILVLFVTCAQPTFACTIFVATSEDGTVLIGRNFDWPADGGRIWFLPGGGSAHNITIFEQNGVDMPFEGINSEGLFIGITAAPSTDTPLIMFRPIRKSLEMVRIVLEQAGTIGEAIAVFGRYDIAFGKFLGNEQIQYLIASADGQSAVISFIDNKMVVDRKPDTCRVLTNHYEAELSRGQASPTSISRYQKAQTVLPQVTSVSAAQELLQTTSQPNTIWSNVYDVKHRRIHVTYQNRPPQVIDLASEMYSAPHGYELASLGERQSIRHQEEQWNLLVRPHFGYGDLDGTSVYHVGGRIMLPAGKMRRYGLEITQFGGDDYDFTAAGIVLEQTLFEWFALSIGTMGYFNFGDEQNNVVGLNAGLGWEPDNHIPFKPYIAFRTDVIFDSDIQTAYSISAGFSFTW